MMQKIDQLFAPIGIVTLRLELQDLKETKPQNTIFPLSFIFFLCLSTRVTTKTLKIIMKEGKSWSSILAHLRPKPILT